GLTDAAARGDTTAQSLLAQDYFYGANGVKKDVHTGVRWATVAAEAGDRDSQELLAVAFGRGHEDIDVDVSRAVSYGEKAAEKGSVKSQELLGKLYYNGTGLEHLSKDERMAAAFKWFREAAEAGSIHAKNDLGDMYRLGHGTKQDYSNAIYWYQKVTVELSDILAADPRLPSAQRNKTSVARSFNSLGAMYASGWGVAKNRNRAIEYLEQAEALGHPHAKRNLETLRPKKETIQAEL
ncbi:esiB, partial [Symbiodinium sp. CCMP2456]